MSKEIFSSDNIRELLKHTGSIDQKHLDTAKTMTDHVAKFSEAAKSAAKNMPLDAETAAKIEKGTKLIDKGVSYSKNVTDTLENAKKGQELVNQTEQFVGGAKEKLAGILNNQNKVNHELEDPQIESDDDSDFEYELKDPHIESDSQDYDTNEAHSLPRTKSKSQKVQKITNVEKLVLGLTFPTIKTSRKDLMGYLKIVEPKYKTTGKSLTALRNQVQTLQHQQTPAKLEQLAINMSDGPNVDIRFVNAVDDTLARSSVKLKSITKTISTAADKIKDMIKKKNLSPEKRKEIQGYLEQISAFDRAQAGGDTSPKSKSGKLSTEATVGAAVSGGVVGLGLGALGGYKYRHDIYDRVKYGTGGPINPDAKEITAALKILTDEFIAKWNNNNNTDAVPPSYYDLLNRKNANKNNFYTESNLLPEDAKNIINKYLGDNLEQNINTKMTEYEAFKTLKKINYNAFALLFLRHRKHFKKLCETHNKQNEKTWSEIIKTMSWLEKIPKSAIEFVFDKFFVAAKSHVKNSRHPSLGNLNLAIDSFTEVDAGFAEWIKAAPVDSNELGLSVFPIDYGNIISLSTCPFESIINGEKKTSDDDDSKHTYTHT